MRARRPLLRHASLVLGLAALFALAGLGMGGLTVAQSLDPARRALDDGWQRAQALGVYDFETHMVQRWEPVSGIRNAGRRPRQQSLEASGRVDRPGDCSS